MAFWVCRSGDVGRFLDLRDQPVGAELVKKLMERMIRVRARGTKPDVRARNEASLPSFVTLNPYYKNYATCPGAASRSGPRVRANFATIALPATSWSQTPSAEFRALVENYPDPYLGQTLGSAQAVESQS